MVIKHFALIIVLLAFCTHCTDGESFSTGDSVKQTNANTEAVQRSKQTILTPQGEYGAQKVNIDPETGQLVSPPEHEVAPASQTEEPSALSSSAEKMEEKLSPVPGGGMMIDLKGQFQSPMSVTIEGNVNTGSEHQTNDQME